MTAKARDTLQLLPRDAIAQTNGVDHADWNYKPILGRIQRLRFSLVRKLLRHSHANRLLEIGYGSGIFMPELDKYCDNLYGIDPHPHHDTVAHTLAKHGVRSNLVSGSAMSMPYEDDFFDTIVAVSAMEFVSDLRLACVEIRRVLAPGGSFVVITPGESPLVDLGLKVLTGKTAKADFADRRSAIMPCLTEHFDIRQRIDVPRFIGPALKLYTALHLHDLSKKRHSSGAPTHGLSRGLAQ